MNVPKLRFKEFTEEWKCKSLINISNNICYGMNSASKDYDGENAYIRITDIDENTGKYIKNNLVSPDGILESKYLVKEHDILFARTGASTGKTYLYCKDDGKLYYAGFLIKANIKKEFNSDFIYQQTKSNNYKKWVKIMSMRSGQPGINSEEYGSYKFSITAIDEQIKIGNLLSLLDKKIELQSNKIEALKLYKKGLMKYCFDNKIANVIIGDILKIGKAGGTPLSSNKNYYGGNIPFLSISDMTNQGKYLKRTKKYITDLGLKNSSTWLIPKNNLILSMYASYGIVSINKIDIATSQAMYCMILKDNINLEYIYQYLTYLYENNYYDRLVSTGTQSNLNADKVNKIKIYLPDEKEQKKISEMLELLDNKVYLETTKYNNLQELKKVLMQSMFI